MLQQDQVVQCQPLLLSLHSNCDRSMDELVGQVDQHVVRVRVVDELAEDSI